MLKTLKKAATKSSKSSKAKKAVKSEKDAVPRKRGRPRKNPEAIDQKPIAKRAKTAHASSPNGGSPQKPKASRATSTA